MLFRGKSSALRFSLLLNCGGPFQWAGLGTIYFQGKIRNSLWYFSWKSGQSFYLMCLVLRLYSLSSTLRVLVPNVTKTIESEYHIIAHLFFTYRTHRTVTLLYWNINTNISTNKWLLKIVRKNFLVVLSVFRVCSTRYELSYYCTLKSSELVLFCMAMIPTRYTFGLTSF